MIVEIISDYPANKCLSCNDYQFKDGNWLSGDCVSKTSMVKNKNRYNNSKACVHHKYVSHTDLNKIIEDQLNETFKK